MNGTEWLKRSDSRPFISDRAGVAECATPAEGISKNVGVSSIQASSLDDLGRWLGVLLAETGSAADPESLHYDCVDVETIANIRDAVRHSFLWVTPLGAWGHIKATDQSNDISFPFFSDCRWATSSSSASTDPRTYDEVSNEDMQVCSVHPKLNGSIPAQRSRS